MKQTQNYQLNQWELTDRIQMEDFNGDNSKVDAALAGLAATMAEHGAALSQHAGAIAKFGNCQIYRLAYQGDDQTSRTFTFPRVPWVVMLCSPDFIQTVVIGQNGRAPYLSVNSNRQAASLSGTSLTLTCPDPSGICNASVHSCVLVALMPMDT